MDMRHSGQGRRRRPLSFLQGHPRDGSATCPLTQHVSGVDLQDQPAVAILLVGAKDGEDGALLAGLGQEAVHKHRLLREREDFPGFPFICAVPAQKKERCQGHVLPAAGHSLPCPAQAAEAAPVPWHSLELVSLGALGNGHQNSTVVTPGVVVGSR